MTLAVAILNYNGEALLRQFLPSVIQHSKKEGVRVVVIDNGSTDASLSVLHAGFPTVEVIKLEGNYGYCGGYNRALQQLSEEVVVLLNSDVEVTQGWLNAPLAWFKADLKLAALQPKILAFNERDKFEYAGAGGGFIDRLGYPFCRGRIFGDTESDKGQYDNREQVFWASGACLFVRREAFLKAGGLDEDFFAHMEEIDLCWRFNRAGLTVGYDGQSTVYHVGGGTLAAGSARKTFYNFRNGLSLLMKNLAVAQLLFKIPLRVMLDWAAAVHFVTQGSPKNGWAVLRAHAAFVAGINKDIDKRLKNSHLGYSITPGLIFKKWLVVEYFLFGRRTFAALKNPK